MSAFGPPKSRRCRVRRRPQHLFSICLTRSRMSLSQFFDRQGIPVEQGCPRTASTCHFVHPTDFEWRKLPNDSPTSVTHSDSHWRSAAGSSPRRSSPPSSSSNYGRERGRTISGDHHRGSSETSLRRRLTTPPRGSSAHHPIRSPVFPSRSPRRDDSPPRRSGPSNFTRDGPLLPRSSPAL